MRSAWVPPASIVVTLGVAVLFGTQALIGASVSAQDPGSGAPGGLENLTVYGHADFDWTIRDLEGNEMELAAFEGEVLFINLWASWCIPCVREMASIERLQHRLDDAPVRFLIVAAEGERPVRRHLRRYPTELPIYLEVDEIPSAFGLRGLPTSWLVDRAGRIVLLRHGEAVWDTDEVEAFMRAVAGSPVERSSSPREVPGLH